MQPPKDRKLKKKRNLRIEGTSKQPSVENEHMLVWSSNWGWEITREVVYCTDNNESIENSG